MIGNSHVQVNKTKVVTHLPILEKVISRVKNYSAVMAKNSTHVVQKIHQIKHIHTITRPIKQQQKEL